MLDGWSVSQDIECKEGNKQAKVERKKESNKEEIKAQINKHFLRISSATACLEHWRK